MDNMPIVALFPAFQLCKAGSGPGNEARPKVKIGHV